MTIKDYFKLKKPCDNCPFRKVGAIELSDGRLDGIIEHLESDDRQSFACHKTVHNERTGGEWDDDDEYHPSGKESECVGAMVYLLKTGNPSVQMRIGAAMGVLDFNALRALSDEVIDSK